MTVSLFSISIVELSIYIPEMETFNWTVKNFSIDITLLNYAYKGFAFHMFHRIKEASQETADYRHRIIHFHETESFLLTWIQLLECLFFLGLMLGPQ